MNRSLAEGSEPPRQRRSRMRRTSISKRVAITTRDICIFRTLARYRYLRSSYLHAFVGGASEKRFIERLGDLFHEGYLDRPAEQWRFADARYLPVVHELGKGGREVLVASMMGSREAVTWLHHGSHRQYEHSLMICEVLASIELSMRGCSDLCFIPWADILAKAPETTRRKDRPYSMNVTSPEVETVTVIPDALFGIEYRSANRKLYRFFALEADRGTMPIVRSNRGQTYYLGKLAAYRAIIANQIYRTQLGLPNFLILTVTTSETRHSEIMRRALEQTGDNAPFLFKAIGGIAAPALQLLTEPWERVGLPALPINDPS